MDTNHMSQEADGPDASVASEVDDGSVKKDLFQTEHLLADLKGRSVRGGAVTLTAQAVKFVLQLGSTMVLARVLTPDDFGLIAMVVAITGFVEMFKDAGLSMATVQRAEITHNQVSTLFWVNVALSVLAMAAVAALAPVVAWLYGEPRLVGITLTLAGTFIFGGLTVQHQALLQRQMKFRALAIIEISSIAAGITIAIVMAVAGLKYWSLVGMTAGRAITNCTLVWFISDWRPSNLKRGSDVRPMLAFGGYITAFNMTNYWVRNLDNILIGAFLGPSSVGIYSKAYGLLTLPLRQFNGPVGSVAVPGLSRMQSQPIMFRRYYMRALGMLVFFTMPLVVFTLVEASFLVSLMLGEQWTGATAVFRALGPAAFLGTTNIALGWILISLGRTRRYFSCSILSLCVNIPAFLIGLKWGIIGVATGFSVATFVLYFPLLMIGFYRSPVRIRDHLEAIFLPAISSIVAAIFIVITTWLISISHEVRFGVSLGGFIFAYMLCFGMFPGGRLRLKEMIQHGRSIVKRYNN